MVADLVEVAHLIQNMESENMDVVAGYKFGCEIN